MELIAMPNFFIVKIDKEKQKQRKEKIGSLYLHHSNVHMERNLQMGEIVAIGSIVSKQFPEAKIGNILVFHHFVESSNFLLENNDFNYYTVTASEYNGRRNETYGIKIENKIIPHPEFIFLEKEQKKKEVSADEFIEQNTHTVGSLILFSNWEETREMKEERAQRITTEIKQATKGRSLSESTQRGIQEKEREAEKITASINKKEYKLYNVAFAHPSLNNPEKVYALNLAVQTEIEVNEKEYYVVQVKYVAGIS